jgi:hypothetical protein
MIPGAAKKADSAPVPPTQCGGLGGLVTASGTTPATICSKLKQSLALGTEKMTYFAAKTMQFLANFKLCLAPSLISPLNSLDPVN